MRYSNISDLYKQVQRNSFKRAILNLSEKLGANATMDDYISDFAKSDAPQFKGRSKEQRKKMAIAAYLDKTGQTREEVNEGAFWGRDDMVKSYKDADKKKGLVRMVKVDGNLTSTMTVKAREIKKWEKKGFKLDPYFDDMREEVELDEAIKYTHAAVDKKGLVIGFASKESDAKDMARRNKGRVVTLTKPLAPKEGDMMVNRPFPDEMDKFPTNTSATQGKRMEEVELDESKMKELAMYIDDIAREMVKDKIMKPFASKFKADAMKSMNPRKSLEKVLPDYIAGKEIANLLNMGMGEEKLNELLPAIGLAVRAAPAVARAVSKINPATIGNAAATVATGAQRAKDYISKKAKAVKKRITGEDVEVIEGYFPEAKSSSGYDLYHNDFSSAMQHAYDHAKKKFGITIDKDEIDDKVATGPRKPSKGKTNSYRLKGDKGAVRIQVYNMGNKFELNMYKESIEEEVELEEGTTKVPTSMADFRGIMNLMKKPIKAKDAERAISKYIDDDYLANGIISIKQKDPNADARPAIVRGFNKLDIRTRGEPSYGSQIKFNRKFEISDKRQKMYLERPPSKDQKNMTTVTLRGGAKVRADYVEMKEKFTMKDFKDNEDANNHTENGVELVNMYGTPAEKKLMAQIAKNHDRRGSIERKEQELRDKLVKKYYTKLESVEEAIDPADVDISATDKDVENASKNIILQLRKVITLNGIKPVEFASGKEKVHPNIAQKALSIHQNLRRTDEKDTFQRKIARSYKDLLNAVKGRK